MVFKKFIYLLIMLFALSFSYILTLYGKIHAMSDFTSEFNRRTVFEVRSLKDALLINQAQSGVFKINTAKSCNSVTSTVEGNRIIISSKRRSGRLQASCTHGTVILYLPEGGKLELNGLIKGAINTSLKSLNAHLIGDSNVKLFKNIDNVKVRLVDNAQMYFRHASSLRGLIKENSILRVFESDNLINLRATCRARLKLKGDFNRLRLTAKNSAKILINGFKINTLRLNTEGRARGRYRGREPKFYIFKENDTSKIDPIFS
jgi:hypothetical protein